MKRTPAFTYASLFSGCGGSSLGYRMAGGKGVFAAEWDRSAAATYALNFPRTPLHVGDIAELTAERVMAASGLSVGELDLLDASPPCQGFSKARVVQNPRDPKNRMWKHVVRLAEEIQPTAIVMENVKAMTFRSNRGQLDGCLAGLRRAGYHVRSEVLNAMHYGVPQARERLILIGVRDDVGVPPSHPAPTSIPRSAGPALAGVVNDPSELRMLLDIGRRYVAFKDWPLLVPGQGRKSLGFSNGYNCLKVDPGRPSPTICTVAGALGFYGLMHWGERRRFTTAEFKRLCSFPDDFTFPGDYVRSVGQMGNAVPPLLAKAIGSHLATHVFPLRDAALLAA